MIDLKLTDKLVLNQARHVTVNGKYVLGCYACKNLDALHIMICSDGYVIVTCKECGEIVAKTNNKENDMNNYKVRCQDCYVLVAGDNDAWICDLEELPVEAVRYCPEGFLPSLVEEFDCLACESLEWDAEYLYCSVDGGLVDELDECPEEEEEICDEC